MMFSMYHHDRLVSFFHSYNIRPIEKLYEKYINFFNRIFEGAPAGIEFRLKFRLARALKMACAYKKWQMLIKNECI